MRVPLRQAAGMDTPNYWYVVFRRAFRETVAVFGWGQSRIFVSIIGFILGCAIFYTQHGISAVLDEINVVLAYVLFGSGGAFLLVLFFNLIRAPAAVWAEQRAEINKLEAAAKPFIQFHPFNNGRTSKLAYGHTHRMSSGKLQTNVRMTFDGYLFLTCTNASSKTVRDCEGYVVSLDVDGTDEQKRQFRESKSEMLDGPVVDPIQLKWAVNETQQVQCDFPPFANRRLMLFRDYGESVGFTQTSLPVNYVHYFKKGFSYVARISLSAVDIPATAVDVRITWNDNGLCYEIVDDATYEAPTQIAVSS